MSKPKCNLIGVNGNVFVLIGDVKYALKKAGLSKQADEFQDKALNCGSYDEVLRLITEYVEVV